LSHLSAVRFRRLRQSSEQLGCTAKEELPIPHFGGFCPEKMFTASQN
jgi:hypothetical protein